MWTVVEYALVGLVVAGVISVGGLLLVTSTAEAPGAMGDAPAVQAPTSSDSCTFWRVPENSGANVLYLMMRAHGIRVDYGDVVAHLQGGREPTSLEDLRRVASEFGFPCIVYSATPESLGHMSLPIIAHVDSLGQGKLVSGRLALLARYSNEQTHVVLYDGTEVVRSAVPRSEFNELWSGVVLAPDPGRMSRAGELVAGAILAIVICGIIWVVERTMRRAVADSGDRRTVKT